MQSRRLVTDVGALQLKEDDTYAFRKNIAMLINAGLSSEQINQAAKDLYDSENPGVYLDNNTLKVWVVKNKDEKQKEEEYKGYEIYAYAQDQSPTHAYSLKITAIEDNSYWKQERETEGWYDQNGRPRFVDIKVACLKAIKWLEVRGKLSTIKLTANTKYRVYFILKTKPIGEKTWDQNLQVTFRLYVPKKGRQESQKSIENSHGWENYLVGEFVNDGTTAGTIKFQMEQLDNIWKQGLVIKGVKFQPEPK